MLAIIHDEFDSDFVAYVLQVRHLFDSGIPEMLNGTSKASVTVPALSFVIPYFFLKPDAAFFVNYILIALAAYTGMYLLCREIFSQKWLCLIAALVFTLLPYYSVYGLSVMGQPLLFYAFVLLKKGKKLLTAYLVILFFALSSSLILVGYADLLILTLCAAGIVIARHGESRNFVLGIIELTVIYIAANFELIAGMLGLKQGFASHKGDYIAASSDFRQAFQELLFEGTYHAASNHKIILYGSFVILLLAVCFAGSMDRECRKKLFYMAGLWASAVVIALLFAFWRWKWVVAKRNEIGGLLVQFQIDRFYWLYPVLWYLIFAYSLYFGAYLLQRNKGLTGLFILCFTLLVTKYGWDHSSLIINCNEVFSSGNTNTGYSSVNDFYQPEMFHEIEDYIGKPQESYRVISVGLYPSIALYNGFYCLDGYSNNYNIDYKHSFRNIISKELEKNSTLKEYFDEWGNRCYVFSSEIPRYYYIDKRKNVLLKSLDLDFEYAKKMGCSYVFSSAEIDNEELIKEKVFESDTSYYKVCLYRIR